MSDKHLRAQVLNELSEAGELIRLKVWDLKETFYMRAEDMAILNKTALDVDRKAFFLAPLDNLLWDRKLVKDIFNFEYSWEVYKPVSSRKYGYYVLPVLYGNQLVARFEPEKHRANEPLSIKKWWWEEGVAVTDNTISAVTEALQAFCSYLKADGLTAESLLKIM